MFIWISFSLFILVISSCNCDQDKESKGNIKRSSKKWFDNWKIFVASGLGEKKVDEIEDKKFIVNYPEPEPYNGHSFDYRLEYSPNIRQIFSKYLKSNQKCNELFIAGTVSDITKDDFNYAIKEADERINQYIENDKKLITAYPDLAQFSEYLYEASIMSKYNEYVSQELAKR